MQRNLLEFPAAGANDDFQSESRRRGMKNHTKEDEPGTYTKRLNNRHPIPTIDPGPQNKNRMRRISMNLRYGLAVLLLTLMPITAVSQMQSQMVPLRPWQAPLYWQPSVAEN